MYTYWVVVSLVRLIDVEAKVSLLVSLCRNLFSPCQFAIVLCKFCYIFKKQMGEVNRGHLLEMFIIVSPVWSHGVMVSTLDFESSDPSSNLGGTSFCFCFSF